MLASHLTSELAKLLPDKIARFAIAFSGGGDSTALVHALKDHPQRGPVFIVDHALRRGSNAEAQIAKNFAEKCGYEVKILTWKNDAPKTAIQEEARRARYGLMGQACRERDIEYLLTGHTQDDQAETLLMRYERQTDWRGAAGIAALSYGPVWPELAMVNICRPLLGISRRELRHYNKVHKLSWAEDPSNENREYSRIRVRDYLKTHGALKHDLIATAKELSNGIKWERENFAKELETAKFGPAGDITFARLPSCELLGLALRSAGGSGAPISRPRLYALYSKLKSGELTSLTLWGGQVVSENKTWIISRDLVAVTGRKDRGLNPRAVPMALTAEAQIWDGRFALAAQELGYDIRANYGLKQERSKRLKAMLSSLHKSVRPTCPVITSKNNAYAVDEIKGITVNSLVKTRLLP